MLRNEYEVIGGENRRSNAYTQEEGLRAGDPLSTILFLIVLAWIFAGVADSAAPANQKNIVITRAMISKRFFMVQDFLK